MNLKIAANTIEIEVNGQKLDVYKNQTVLQSLQQADEIVKHNCMNSKSNHFDMNCSCCTVKADYIFGVHNFKACVTPVQSGMKIKTRTYK